ncbi:iron-containing alcohol dehydrogenase [Clostridium estertheticum]|uniref:Iron-containing alcohol dehydrogenase n=1 Tax=Clostridium estertheticum TaxID=238834 RepID=A0AA47I709_9CLOT|nr:iron-containing alcohol dehydrogenase [Clostridium estertheticum]MBU3155629.1 iron-containing alcohol dehydrogenase [Clostridium estertheticum]WAG59979.1 iron-containing alcohol dehydrogenase [Clostridium estertheticum]
MGRYAQTCPIICGAGTISLLGEEAKKLGCTKVMIVSDETVAQLEGYAKAKQSLIDSGIEIVEFKKVIADPPDYIINEGGEIAKSEKIDGIVAIGGGSPMDAAKGINVLVNNPGPVNKYFGNPFYTPGVPVIMVVATAGTGSESTSIGVITDTINNVKNSVICNSTLGILDPEITISVPKDITANTGIDTMSHAVEAITAKDPNPKSELLATDAIKKVMQYLPIAMSDGKNIEARENLLLASNFAGLAFNDALVHIGHAIAHSVGAKFHVTHGVICGLVMPEVMKYAADFKADKVKVVGEAMGIRFSGNETDIEIGEIVAVEMRKFVKKVGIKSLKELGIVREELIGIAEMVLADACYNFVPKQLTKEEVQVILGNMYDNYK